MTSRGDDRRSQKLTNMIVRRGYLKKEDFESFLKVVKEVATYDPERKLWIISPAKVVRLAREGRLKETLSELSKYAQVDEDAVIALVKETRRATLNLEPLSIVFSSKPEDELISSLTAYGYWKGKVLRLRSVVYLPKIRELLSGYGLSLDGDLERALTATIERKDGRLLVRFNVRDYQVIKTLSSSCTLIYKIEKAILSPDGTFEGTEIVERKIKTYRILDKGLLFSAPVGLIERITDTLSRLGFRIIVNINVLPDIKLDLKPNFTLLPYQEEAFRRWMVKKRGTIAIFTRGGKSFIALKAIETLRKPTIIFVPTRELLETWRDYFEKYLGVPRSRIGVLGGGECRLREITVAIYNSGVKYAEKLRGLFELAVFDEAHHVPASTFKEVALKIDSLYRMALSATPKRRDGNEELLFALCGELLFNMGYKELLEHKVVAPIEIYEVIFVEDDEEKMQKLIEILRRHKDAKVIVFTQYLSTAKKIHERLDKEGFPVLLITGETPPIKRQLAFREFQRQRNIIMVTTTVLDEGITVPDAEVAVIYEGTGEARQMIQRIGRVLGYAPGKTAKVYEIVNMSNTKEKYAYFRRRWVQNLYLFKGLDRYILRAKGGG